MTLNYETHFDLLFVDIYYKILQQNGSLYSIESKQNIVPVGFSAYLQQSNI